jgi:ribosomal protein S18 acetylase RimI-like enzyme
MTTVHLRRATVDEARFVLHMSEIAGHGFLPHYFRQSMPEGEDLQGYILDRVRDPDSKMSYRKCWIAEMGGVPVGMINLDAIPDPAPQPAADLPPMFQPLAALEASAPGTTVIEFVATLPTARGCGVGRALLRKAEKERGRKGLALVVSDNNHSARRLYAACGFEEVARRPIITQGWETSGTQWILMTRD